MNVVIVTSSASMRVAVLHEISAEGKRCFFIAKLECGSGCTGSADAARVNSKIVRNQ